MSLTRINNWESALAEFIENRRNMPFNWGANDCCLFAADGVYTLTGVDLASDLRGYTDALGAACHLKPYGGDVVRLVDEAFSANVSRVPVAFAQRGDVIAVLDDGRHALGLCLGRHSAFVGVERLGHVETMNCVAAWHY